MFFIQKNSAKKIAATWVHHLEMKVLFWSCLVIAALGGLLPAIAGESEIIHPSKDTFARPLTSARPGFESIIRVKNLGLDTCVGVVQFRLNTIANLKQAELHLDLASFTANSNRPAEYLIWGVKEGGLQEDWDEMYVFSQFHNFLQISTSIVRKAAFHRGVPLASFKVTGANLNKTVVAESSLFDEFLSGNKNQVVTLVITQVLSSARYDAAFASREHESLNPPRLFIEQEEVMVTPKEDAFVRNNDSRNYGASPHIKVKNFGGGGSNGVRKGIIQFRDEKFKKMVAKNAALLLDVSGYYETNGPTTSEFFVWGFKDSSSLETFDENTVIYNDYNAVFNSSPSGTNQNETHLYDPNKANLFAQHLGKFSISQSQVGETVAFHNQNLVDFFNANRDSDITFAITRKTDSSSLNTYFASKEHATLNPPRLYVQPQLEEVTPNVSSELKYIDVDHDGEGDLVLIINDPNGGGFAIADPFIMAEFMMKVGIGIGKGNSDAYYQKLSTTQQQSLHNSIHLILYNDCVEQATTTTVTASQIHEVLAGLPSEREYPVTRTYYGELDSGTAPRNMVVVELEGCTLAEFALGYRTVTITGPSAQAGFFANDDGMAFGATGSVITVTDTIGNTNGTYAGMSASYGVGFWASASWGGNDQYGFTVPVGFTPFSVSLYVKGGDVVDVYTLFKDASIIGGTAIADFYDTTWYDGVDWSKKVSVSLKDQTKKTKLAIRRESQHAKVWIESYGDKTFTEMSGTAGEISNEMNDMANTLATSTGSLARELEDWSASAETVVTDLWNDASGWVEGAANTASKAVKKITKWF